MIGLLIVAAGGYALWRLYKSQTCACAAEQPARNVRHEAIMNVAGLDYIDPPKPAPAPKPKAKGGKK
jgi:hypothetical protein